MSNSHARADHLPPPKIAHLHATVTDRSDVQTKTRQEEEKNGDLGNPDCFCCGLVACNPVLSFRVTRVLHGGAWCGAVTQSVGACASRAYPFILLF